ncbi:hypothetical protein N7517_005391 [Penicillium concentricum]|uniref:Uncharacterized protein n=1 Tax=Penicillium concentricum TaxID=293559 RepID=A0A9W9S7P3_9EURO|nr:uncharacterized protein N7517_005391 [Penicillium concentricum]KAJ5373385.1 hypothetical protein N7517_005391 [Penicillium concentricum]
MYCKGRSIYVRSCQPWSANRDRGGYMPVVYPPGVYIGMEGFMRLIGAQMLDILYSEEREQCDGADLLNTLLWHHKGKWKLNHICYSEMCCC